MMKSTGNYSSGDDLDLGFSAAVTIEGDREKELALQQQQYDAAADVLKAIGGLLQGADSTLQNLEDNVDILPSAILRRCQELADGIGALAGRLEEHSPEEQRALAQACAQDFQQLDAGLARARQEHELALQANMGREDDQETETLIPTRSSTSSRLSVSPPTEDDFLRAIQGAATLLRDVEAAFRDISETDAEDIADAALTLARLFLMSLQNVHETLTPDDFFIEQQNGALRNSAESGVIIEELDENGEEVQDENETSNKTEQNQRSSEKRKKQPRRVRVLWPRLGPEVARVLGWAKEAAAEQPLLAVALGLTLWPAAIITTVIGGSVVLADNVVQDIYQHFQDGPIVSNLEQGAAQVLQAGKLGLVLTSVVGKQTWRVVQRQVKRHGGVEKIANSVKDAAVERFTHPVETVSMAWNGLVWGVFAVTDTVQQILQQREELLTVQDLQ